MRQEALGRVQPLIDGLRDADEALLRGDTEMGTRLAVECGEALDKMAVDRVLAGMSESQCEAAGGVERMMEKVSSHAIAWVAGGNQTLTGDAKILTPDGEVRIDEFQGGRVVSWDGANLVSAFSTRGFLKGKAECFRVHFQGGAVLTMTAGHQFVFPSGEIVRLDHVIDRMIQGGKISCRRLDLLGFDSMPSFQFGRVPESSGLGDSPVGCHVEDHLYGGHALVDGDCVQSSPMRQDDVPPHTSRPTSDGPAETREHIHSLRAFLRAKCGSFDHGFATEALRDALGDLGRIALQSGGADEFLLPTPLLDKGGRPVELSHLESFLPCESPVVWGCGEQLPPIVQIDCVGVKEIWDIHVVGANCYFAGGTLHHNSGKSFLSSAMFARHLMTRAKGGEVYWVISPSAEKSVGTVQRYLWEMLPKSWLGSENVWTEKNGFGSVNPILSVALPGQDRKLVVKFKNQSQYDNDPTSFESETLSGAWVDESVREKCWQALQPRLVVRGGWVLYSSIPSEGWMWQAFEESEDKSKVLVVKLWAGDNPAITPEALERLKASITDPDEYEMRINGRFKIVSGVVFREFDASKHVVKAEDMPPVEDLSFYGGLDVGWDHPTGFVVVGVDKSGICWVYDEYSARLKTVEENAKAIQAVLKMRGIKLVEPVKIDPSCASITSANRVSVLKQFEKAGLICTKARRTQDIGEKVVVNNIRQMIADNGLFVSDRCHRLIREMKVWQYKRKNDGEALSGEAFVDKDNDMIDALKYCLSGNLRYVDPKKPKVKAIFT